MEIRIDSHEKEGGRDYITMTCGKRSAYISYSKDSYINVCCKNASHMVWRGAGKVFWNGWDEAVSAYKSAGMKAMINEAKRLLSV